MNISRLRMDAGLTVKNLATVFGVSMNEIVVVDVKNTKSQISS